MPPEYLVAIISSGTTVLSTGIIGWLIKSVNGKVDRIETRLDCTIEKKIDCFPFSYRQKVDCDEMHKNIDRKIERFEDKCRENHLNHT